MKRLVIPCLLVGLLTPPAPADNVDNTLRAGLETLTSIRTTLRDRLADRAAKDAAVEPARDVRLVIRPGLGRGETVIQLRRQGGQWFVRSADAGPRGPADLSVDPSGLTWTDERIAGPLTISWGRNADQADHADAPDPRRQTFDLDLRVRPVDPRLILRFHRITSGRDWVLSYRRQDGKWVLDQELETPGHLRKAPDGQAENSFRRAASPIAPDDAGRLSGRIDLAFTGAKTRIAEAYAGHQPVITFAGQLVDGQMQTQWVLKAPHGKGLLGSGRDMLTGAVRTAELVGSFRADGRKGQWMGDLAGAVSPVVADPTAWLAEADRAAHRPSDNPAATARAAELYRQIRALRAALRDYPAPLTDTMARTLVPEPHWPDGTPVKFMQRYVDALLVQARRTLDEADEVPVGQADNLPPAFGPHFGRSQWPDPDAPDQVVPRVKPGPQQWRATGKWEMIGPFGVFDQQAPVHYPELPAVPRAGYERTRFFTTRDGEVETVTDIARWIDARMDGARVCAPPVPEASAASMRYIAWYARTTLRSETDQDAWLAMKLEGQAVVWLNGRRVWQSGAQYDAHTPARFPVRLEQGENQLLIRCASNPASNAHGRYVDYLNGNAPRPAGRIDFTSLALLVCTQGSPDDAAGDDSRAQPPPADAPTRFRRDGSGVYPDADWPLAWDLDEDVNVDWTAEVPYGTGQPVVRGGRLYLPCEPAGLLCVDATSGERLWQRDLVPPPPPPAEGEDPIRTETATAAPVVTDDRVYAVFGTGEAVCFDLAGRQVWKAQTGDEWHHANIGSPLLVEGLLICQTHTRHGRGGSEFHVLALDAETGERVWSASAPPRRTTTRYDWTGFGPGLALCRLARGQRSRALVITGDGGVLDARTGELLHRRIFSGEAAHAAPVVVGDAVYTAPLTGEQAVRLWLDETGRVGARTLWRNGPRWGMGQTYTIRRWGESHWMPEPIVRDGRMYVVRIDSSHVPGHYVCPWTQLEILDVTDGRRLVRLRANLREATDPTIAPALAGRYLYVADGGAPVTGFGGTHTHGQMAVLEIMDVPADRRDVLTYITPSHNGTWGLACRVSRNRIGRTRCAPVFADDRMFLRSFNALTCVRTTTDAGRRYQMRQLADATLKDHLGRRPEEVETVSPDAADRPAGDGPVVRAGPGRSADAWWVLGPLPLDAGDDVLAALGGPEALRGLGDETITVAGQTLAFRPVDPNAFVAPGQLDASAALDGQRSAIGYFHATLECARAQDVRYDPPAIVAAAWIGGRPVARGDIVHLPLGYVPLLVKVRLDRVPTFITPKLTLGFKRVPTSFDSPARWNARAVHLAERLRTICQALPRTAYARTTRVVLNQVGLDAPPRSRATRPASVSAETGRGYAPPSPANAPEPPAPALPAWVWPAGLAGGIVLLAALALFRRSRADARRD